MEGYIHGTGVSFGYQRKESLLGPLVFWPIVCAVKSLLNPYTTMTKKKLTNIAAIIFYLPSDSMQR